jgi:hypothetical protein
MSLSESLPAGALDPAAAALERVFTAAILEAGLGIPGRDLPPDIRDMVQRSSAKLAATVIDLTAPYLTTRTED